MTQYFRIWQLARSIIIWLEHDVNYAWSPRLRRAMREHLTLYSTGNCEAQSCGEVEAPASKFQLHMLKVSDG